ncbi:addiction module HigA family antidote [Rhodoblastus acidophilus]|nr:addiction module HigA family antidote [Rhodoblastus acidophilus]MCW2332499.1 addiction module HigA family antidote [Rhodoblastus acidophilus]
MSITTEEDAMSKLPPIHPGEILREEFLTPLGLSAGKVALAIGVPRTRIERLAKEQVDLSPDTALRLARFFRTTPAFWMEIQSRYALESAEDAIASELAKIEPMLERA